MRGFWFSICGAALVAAGDAAAADKPTLPATELAARIDAHLRKGWASAGVKAPGPSDDATFLRRVSLDLLGRIPTVEEVRGFESDTSADKRARLVRAMLDRPDHARHWATVWRRAWLPQADTVAFANLADDFEDWLRAGLARNAPYDQLVREVLTTASLPGPQQRGGDRNKPTPRAFMAGNEHRPENLAASSSRAFLGVNIDCAQCHNHPFARWTRDQFWQTAAFYVRPVPVKDVMPVRLEMTIPGTTQTVPAKLFTDESLTWPQQLELDTGRKVLAEWVTTRTNPYFARNGANRVWAQFFGTGLVEPLDDLSDSNPASHPELLAELAKAFADSGFDLGYLTTALVLSEAYQCSSEAPPGSKVPDRRLFARMPVRGLTGEQLYDSLRTASGMQVERDDLDPVAALRERRRFADRFRIDRPVSAERSILQALALMNGGLTAKVTDAESSPTLAAAADAPFLDTADKVEMLYLATLGRKPRPAESAAIVRHVDAGDTTLDKRKRLGDALWALVNSSEFNTNH